jgi:hypothetical protein
MPGGDRGGQRTGHCRPGDRQGADRVYRCRSPFPALRRGQFAWAAAPSAWSTTTVITRSRCGRDRCRSARRFPGRRLLLAFQPHRYTRTRDCFEDFVKVLSGVDALVLSEVYAAGEQAIVAADGRALARALRVAGKVEPVFVDQVGDLPQAILDAARDGDVVMTMGAGSIGGVPGKLVGG